MSRSNSEGLKIKSLHIKDYKMFKDFDIDFVDKEKNILPLIVIAGVNGSGKTTILEIINNLSFTDTLLTGTTIYFNKTSLMLGNISTGSQEAVYNKVTRTGKINKIKENIIYLPVDKNIEEIKVLLPDYLHKIVWNEDILASVAFKRVKDYINTIFQELDMMIEFDSRDGEGNLFFKNKQDEIFSIDEISTGEKTLIAKVLYLYLADVKSKVILIDEPELSLHPSWQNKILKIYENFAIKNNCQVIIATHSPHIIGSAKNEYLRILKKNDEGHIEVVDNALAYGRDIEWVLEEVMGTDYLRNKKILERIEACQDLINKEKYDEAEEAIDRLEELIGEHDRDILALRNDLAFGRIDFEEDS